MRTRAPKIWRMLVLGCVLGLGGAVLSRLPGTLALDQSIGLATLFAVTRVPAPPDRAVVVAISGSTFENLGLPDELDE